MVNITKYGKFDKFEKNISKLPKLGKEAYLKEQVISFINALKSL